MNFRLRAYSLQDIGQRPSQQDCCFPPFIEPCQFDECGRDMVYYDGVPHTDDRLFILCDGMGGHDRGEVASQTVTAVMSRELLHSSTLEGQFDDRLIRDAVGEAMRALDKADNPPVENGMGTTMTVLKFHADGATVGHIGDSRVYHFRPADEENPARVLFRTVDHNAPYNRHLLTRCMMSHASKLPEVDIDHITDIKAGDIFLLCSDGLVERMSDEQLCSLVTNPNYGDVERIKRLLIETDANRDNHSAVIVRVKEVVRSSMGFESLTLPAGTVLKSENFAFHIEKELGSGAFGNTYLASMRISMKGQLGTIHTGVNVALKEFCVKDEMVRRDGKLEIMGNKKEVEVFEEKFRAEARLLSMLTHPNIVRVLEIFEANNTVYYAMEYLQEGSLDQYVGLRFGLKEKEALACIRQIGSAVAYMHANGFLHLDLKPANVMRMGDSTLKLIDFGLARHYDPDAPAEEESHPAGTHGYAPIEQCDRYQARKLTPATDVYALGATYYKLLTFMSPDDAEDVKHDGLNLQPLKSKHVSQKSIDAIVAAMNPDQEKRLQTADGFINMLPGVEELYTAEKSRYSLFGWLKHIF